MCPDISLAWMTQAIWDILIFSLMIHKTLKIRQFREAHSLLTGIGLVDLIWRDGAVYFGIMALATLVNIGFFYVKSDGLRGTLAPVASRYVDTNIHSSFRSTTCQTLLVLTDLTVYLCL